MTPDEIRRLYHRERAATDEEAAETTESMRTDPATARAMIATLYSLSVEDRHSALLLKLFLEGTLMRLVEERAGSDDAFALACGGLIADLMRDMASPHPPRAGAPAGHRSPDHPERSPRCATATS